MRTYQLQPGKLLEWEASWRRGLEARRKFVVSLSKSPRRSGGETSGGLGKNGFYGPSWLWMAIQQCSRKAKRSMLVLAKWRNGRP